MCLPATWPIQLTLLISLLCPNRALTPFTGENPHSGPVLFPRPNPVPPMTISVLGLLANSLHGPRRRPQDLTLILLVSPFVTSCPSLVPTATMTMSSTYLGYDVTSFDPLS